MPEKKEIIEVLYDTLEEANHVIHDLAIAYIMTLPDGDERSFFPLYERIKSALDLAREELKKLD